MVPVYFNNQSNDSVSFHEKSTSCIAGSSHAATRAWNMRAETKRNETLLRSRHTGISATVRSIRGSFTIERNFPNHARTTRTSCRERKFDRRSWQAWGLRRPPGQEQHHKVQHRCRNQRRRMGARSIAHSRSNLTALLQLGRGRTERGVSVSAPSRNLRP